MADERYWEYHAATPTPTLADANRAGVAIGWTEQQWCALTPGMRREIVRSTLKAAS